MMPNICEKRQVSCQTSDPSQNSITDSHFESSVSQNETSVTRPEHVEESHWLEWIEGSGVAPEIVAANVQSLKDEAPYNYLLYSEKIERRNDGRVRDWALRRYQHVEEGGWWCAGIDVTQLTKAGVEKESMWGCFKPNTPQKDKDGKVIKYESPLKVDAEVFCLRDPFRPLLWTDTLNTPSETVFITEGPKKAGCLLTHGFTAIAVPGVTLAVTSEKNEATGKVSRRYLIPQIEAFAVPKRPIYIVFDQDKKLKTILNVSREIFKLALLLTKAGCIVKIVEWNPELGKGVDDLIVGHGVKTFEQAVEEAQSFDLWVVRQYTRLTYTSSIQLNQRYLSELEIPDSAKLIALKSPKGTGKTESLKYLVAQARSRGQRVLLITHRVQLTEEICGRVGLPSIYKMREALQGNKAESIKVWDFSKQVGYGLCIDSLHPQSQANFEAEDWKDALIIIDEAEQVIWHAFNSSTCTKERVSILQELRDLLDYVLSPNSEGRLILSDADLTDLSIDLAKTTSGRDDLEPFIVLNNYKPEKPWTVYNHEKLEDWLSALETRISSGEKVLVLLDSQKLKGKFSTSNLEARWKKKFGAQVLRIDSDTLEREDSEAFGCIAKGLDQVLRRYNVVIASPSIETGVSIDLKGHFSSVWGCFKLLPSNSIRQALARLRESVERHIYVAPYGLERIASGETSANRLLESSNKMVRANLRLIGDAATGNAEFYGAALQCWSKMAARINALSAQLRKSVLEGLKAEGHRVVEVDQELNEIDVKKLKQELKANRNENQRQDAEETAAVSLIDEKQAAELEMKRSKRDKTEQRELRKYHLHKRYAGAEITPELVLKDDEGWNSKIRLHYYLTTGQQFLQRRDQERFDELAIGENYWTPDVNKSLLSTPIALLEYFDIVSLLQKREFRNDDQDLIKLRDKAFAHRAEIQQGLKFSIHVGDSPEQRAAKQALIDAGMKEKIDEGDSPVVVARKFLKKLGLRLEELRRERDGDKRTRVYKLVGLDDGRGDVFTSWLLRDVDKTGVEVCLSSLLSKAFGEISYPADTFRSSAGNKYISSEMDLAKETIDRPTVDQVRTEAFQDKNSGPLTEEEDLIRDFLEAEE